MINGQMAKVAIIAHLTYVVSKFFSLNLYKIPCTEDWAVNLVQVACSAEESTNLLFLLYQISIWHSLVVRISLMHKTGDSRFTHERTTQVRRKGRKGFVKKYV